MPKIDFESARNARWWHVLANNGDCLGLSRGESAEDAKKTFLRSVENPEEVKCEIGRIEEAAGVGERLFGQI